MNIQGSTNSIKKNRNYIVMEDIKHELEEKPKSTVSDRELIRTLIEERGYTLRFLARQLRMTHNYLYQLLNGHYPLTEEKRDMFFEFLKLNPPPRIPERLKRIESKA